MAHIVLLHGWGRGSKSFGVMKGLLEEKGHRVHCLDLPGFGITPPPAVPWAVDDYVNFIREFIKKENLQNFYLFGHSFGGQISIKLAAQHPENLRGLILSNAAGIRPRPTAKVLVFRFLSKPGKMIFSLPILFMFSELARKFVYWLSGERDYYHLQDSVMRETFQRVIREDLTDYFSKVKVPTLIIWGKLDKMTPVADAYTMHENIIGSRLEILEDIGHNPHIEAAEKLVKLIDEFVLTTS